MAANTKGLDLFAAMAAVDLTAMSMSMDDGVWGPVEEGDTVLGVMSENLQRIFCVRANVFFELRSFAGAAREKGIQLIARHLEEVTSRVEGEELGCTAFQKEIEDTFEETYGLQMVCDRVSEILSDLIALELGLESTQGLIVREGFQVVKPKGHEEEIPLHFKILVSRGGGRGKPA